MATRRAIIPCIQLSDIVYEEERTQHGSWTHAEATSPNDNRLAMNMDESMNQIIIGDLLFYQKHL